MENERFDRIAKALAGTGSRRSTLRAWAAAPLAAVLAGLGATGAAAATCKKPGRKCGKDKDCCNKRCKKGKCRCRKVGRTCSSFINLNDCCGSMSCLGAAGATTCCISNNLTCSQTSDCCGDEVCETAPGGRKRCCRRKGEICQVGPVTKSCCNGLVCDTAETGTCISLGLQG